MRKRLIWLALAAALCAGLLAGCAPKKPSDETSSSSHTTETEDASKLKVIENGETEFAIVRAEKMSPGFVGAVDEFKELLERTYGVSMEYTTDAVEEGEEVPGEKREILIGKTNRPASGALLKQLPDTTFGIEITASQVVIVASSDTLLEAALEYFVGKYVKADGSLILPIGEKYVSEIIYSGVYKKYDFANMPENLMSRDELLYSFLPTGDYWVLQGGCSDGKYFYMCMENNQLAKHESLIYKIDMATGELVAKSASLQLDHSNDVTYNSRTHELIVAHNAPRRNVLSVVDPDTLEIKRTFKIPLNIFSIAYEPVRNVYVIGLYGTQNFTVLNENFEMDFGRFEGLKDLIYVVKPTGYTTQGCECDESYIYFVQYAENVIMIYDWDGNFIRQVKLSIPSSYEPENITVVGDEIYVGVYIRTGGAIYRTEILPEQ